MEGDKRGVTREECKMQREEFEDRGVSWHKKGLWKISKKENVGRQRRVS